MLRASTQPSCPGPISLHDPPAPLTETSFFSSKFKLLSDFLNDGIESWCSSKKTIFQLVFWFLQLSYWCHEILPHYKQNSNVWSGWFLQQQILLCSSVTTCDSQVCQSVQWNAVWLQYWFDKLTKTQYIGLNGENMRQCISLVTKSNFTASLNNSMVAQVEKSKSYIQKAGFFGFQNLKMILIFW